MQLGVSGQKRATVGRGSKYCAETQSDGECPSVSRVTALLPNRALTLADYQCIGKSGTTRTWSDGLARLVRSCSRAALLHKLPLELSLLLSVMSVEPVATAEKREFPSLLDSPWNSPPGNRGFLGCPAQSRFGPAYAQGFL